MDLDLFEVRHGAEKIELSPKAFEVLRALLEAPERTLTKQELLDAVWPNISVTEAVLTQAVHTVRRALEAHPDVIQTVRGRGYRMGVPVAVDSGTDESESSRSIRPWRPLRAGGVLAAAALLIALVWLARAPDVAEIPIGRSLVSERDASHRAIAVLPFVDMNPDGRHEHIADGVTEEIIAALATLPGMNVAARTSVFAFKDRAEDVRSIGSELGVGSVLEGSVRVSGPRVRVAAQLIEVRTGFHLWSKIYEQPVEDIFAVEQDIAAAIRAELEGRLLSKRTASNQFPPRSFEAYQLYRRGRAAYFLRTRAGFEQALTLFEESLAIDPKYAAAWAGVSDVHRSVYAIWPSETRDGPMLAAAERAARKALEFAPESAEAHTALANIHNVRHRDWPAAEAGYREAIRLSPGWPDAHLFYASLLMKRRRLPEAAHHIDRALALDPLSAYVHRQRGRVAYFAGDLDGAISHLRRGLELNPDDPDAPRLLWSAHLANGMEEHANEAYLRLLPEWQRPGVRLATRLFGPRWVISRFVDLAFWVQSRSGDAREDGSRWRRSGDWGLALALAWLGDSERMYACLERGADRGLGYITVEPVFDRYRNDPRFIHLLARAGYAI